MENTIVVTGGAGFIGSAMVHYLIEQTDQRVVNIDKLTYSGNRVSLASVEDHPRYRFVQADICDRQTIEQVLEEERPRAVIHLAAESHVDRSIDNPLLCVQTNMTGTTTLLECATDD